VEAAARARTEGCRNHRGREPAALVARFDWEEAAKRDYVARHGSVPFWPPSSMAPHAIVVKDMTQFPVRSGTTTRYLGESELAELYARRAAIASAQETDEPLLHGVMMPPWMTQAGLDISGVGVMRITASAAARRPAPGEYLLRERLGEAVTTANAAIVPGFISAPKSPGILDPEGWRPLEARGWYRYADELPGGYLQRDPTYSTTYLYSSGFSYQITVPLDVNGKLYIYEHLWASNLVGALAITAAFSAEDASAALLRVDVGLEGLDGGTPGPNERRFGGKPRRIVPYAERRIFSLVDVATDPVGAAESLLARFLASIDPSGSDVFRTLTS
jgi:hypothetical protein